MTHVGFWHENMGGRPRGERWDRETGVSEPISLPEPAQPHDPLGAAAAEYCRLRHQDTDEVGACRGNGECRVCRETVAAIVRAYQTTALTRGE